MAEDVLIEVCLGSAESAAAQEGATRLRAPEHAKSGTRAREVQAFRENWVRDDR